MMYWSSTKAPVHLFKRVYEDPLTAWTVSVGVGVDPKILSDNMGIPHLNSWAVAAYQRRLGVRKIAENNPRGGR